MTHSKSRQPICDLWLPLVEGPNRYSQEVTHEQVQKEFAVVSKVLRHQVVSLWDRGLQFLNKDITRDHVLQHAGSELPVTHIDTRKPRTRQCAPSTMLRAACADLSGVNRVSCLVSASGEAEQVAACLEAGDVDVGRGAG